MLYFTKEVKWNTFKQLVDGNPSAWFIITQSEIQFGIFIYRVKKNQAAIKRLKTKMHYTHAVFFDGWILWSLLIQGLLGKLFFVYLGTWI